jgi:queuine tRNA-ribosyltransferase
MRHNGPLITDSGGFQIFSLANQGGVHGDVGEIAKSKDLTDTADAAGGELKRAVAKKASVSGEGVVSVTEEGVVFRSYRDGTYVSLTPESTVQAQKQYGSDIIIPLDEVPSRVLLNALGIGKRPNFNPLPVFLALGVCIA